MVVFKIILCLGYDVFYSIIILSIEVKADN
jgi:hypothetical protein